MIRGKWLEQGSDLSVPLAIRQAVFARGRDSLDDMAQQVIVYDGTVPVGTARLWWAEGAFWLGEMGVLPECRGKGFGDLLLRLLLFKALSHHATRVELTAPALVAPFFARYGFAPTAESAQGESPVRMTIRAEEIALSHCKKACDGDCSACESP